MEHNSTNPVFVKDVDRNDIEAMRTHLLLTLDIGHVESYEETVVVQQRRLVLG